MEDVRLQDKEKGKEKGCHKFKDKLLLNSVAFA